MNNPIWALIKKDLTVEWRQRYAINGIVLHTLSSTLVAFLSIKTVNAPSWNALFWIILVFASVSAVAKSFIAESQGKQLYFYGLVTGQQLIISKIIYNACLTMVVSLLAILTYALFLGFPVEHKAWYMLILILGAIGFSTTFTLLSAIASKSGNGNLLMPVLSLPVIIPLLLVAIKASKKAIDGLDQTLIYKEIAVLCALNVLVMVLAYILFPFLWKD